MKGVEAPLLLPLIALFPTSAPLSFSINLLYVMIDLLSADVLMRIADTGEAGSSKVFTSSRKDAKRIGLSLAAA